MFKKICGLAKTKLILEKRFSFKTSLKAGGHCFFGENFIVKYFRISNQKSISFTINQKKKKQK